VLLGADLENLPPLPPAAVPWILGALLATWLLLRVWILRGHLRDRSPGDAGPAAWAPLLALAKHPLALPLLLLLVIALASGAWLATR
jgi:hypothetical protein